MVGFSQSFVIEGAEAEAEKDGCKSEASLDSKKPPTPNDPLDICLPELEDFSLSFSNSFLDFDSIDGWFAEDSDFCPHMNMAGLGPVGGELGDFKEGSEAGERISVKDGVEEALGAKDASLCSLEHGKGENGVFERSVALCNREGCESANGDGDLGSLIGEQLGKVSLEGKNDCLVPPVASENDSVVNGCDGASEMVNAAGDVIGAYGNEVKIHEIKGGGDDDESSSGSESGSEDSRESGSDSESESEGSSSSASSDSSSSGSDEKEDKKLSSRRKEIGIEEGEIVLSDVDEMVGWSDGEDDGSGNGVVGPVMSKNELKVLPPVPSVTVTLEPHHQTLPVGTILSIVGAQVIVEGLEKHNPLNEGSILWITDSRMPLGIVDEIFGPVKNPYYVVRYNSETELPAGIQQGTPISFVQEFANHILNDKSLYQKGYDASGENDEEVLDELEFSDDEKEAEYKRMLKMKKRGTNESKPGNKGKDKRQLKNKTRNWNHDPGPAAHGDKPPFTEDHNLFPSTATLSGVRQNIPGNQPMVPPLLHGVQTPCFPASSGIWSGGFQPQHPQSMGLSNGLPSIGVPWMHQNQANQLYQAPSPNMAFPQQIGTFPMFPLNFNALGGQANFGGVPALGPWPAHPDQKMLNALQFAMQASLPQNGGGEQVVQAQGFQTGPSAQTSPAASGKPPNFNQGRGGGRRGQHRGRGRFGTGRGRHQGQ